MEISANLPGIGQTQPLRAPQKPEGPVAPPPSVERREAETADVRVSISAQARAAEAIEREAGPEQAAAAQVNRVPAAESADPVASAERLEAPRAAESASAAEPGREAAAPQGGSPAVRSDAPARAPERAEQDARAQGQAREPDAPSAAKNPAVELYLSNAAAPQTRPPVAPIRASA